jgi:hypothetical protein
MELHICFTCVIKIKRSILLWYKTLTSCLTRLLKIRWLRCLQIIHPESFAIKYSNWNKCTLFFFVQKVWWMKMSRISKFKIQLRNYKAVGHISKFILSFKGQNGFIFHLQFHQSVVFKQYNHFKLERDVITHVVAKHNI